MSHFPATDDKAELINVWTMHCVVSWFSIFCRLTNMGCVCVRESAVFIILIFNGVVGFGLLLEFLAPPSLRHEDGINNPAYMASTYVGVLKLNS